MNLDIGLPVQELRPVIRQCLNGGEARATVTVDAVNRRGRALRCQIVCSPLTDGASEVRGVILIMEDEQVSAPPAGSAP
jgi:two-component system CheB/CheR fusion protein